MYHPQVIKENLKKLEEAFKFSAQEYSIDEVSEWVDRLRLKKPIKDKPVLALSSDEFRFINNEKLLTKVSFKYWAERYAYINLGASALGRIYPLLESQQFIINEIGRIELSIYQGEREDGILVNLLKGARQIGGSTLAECILAHRCTTQDNLQGLIASDVPDEKGSGYLFGMFERIIDNLPWWLKPEIIDRVKNSEISFDGGSHIWVDAGKSVRGTTGDRGQLARGKSISIFHLSELSTWEMATQIDSSLMPAVPRSPRTFGFCESTAKGRNNWWHQHWEVAKTGKSRFINVFIPWYAEPGKYSLTPPVNWQPQDSTLSYAKRAEELGPRWTHTSVSLSKEQLYWYEFTRSTYEVKDDFKTFLEEFGSVDDNECFQFSGKSIFSLTTIQRIVETAKPILAVIEIASHDSLLPPAKADGPFLVPPGMGMRIIPTKTWKSWFYSKDGLSTLMGYLLVWQAPRRGFQYVLSADIGDGIGQDRSCLDVTRIATIAEPDEQVAQFICDDLDPVEFARIIDVVGRFYKDVDGLEAIAAIEVNNHGMATQMELERHLGYTNLFIWEYWNKADASKSKSNALGWYTTRSSRPLMITLYVRKVKFLDPNTGKADYQINSPFTIEELRDFQTLDSIVEAEAAQGAHDDAIMTGCIGVQVAQLINFNESEDLDSARKRIAAERARKAVLENNLQTARDFYNTDCTVEEMTLGKDDGDN